jgi:signal transduction histidine kinase
MIVLSGILGVIGATEITKCAQMHKLNSLHLKHNYRFANELQRFHQNENVLTKDIRSELELVRQQPVDCLGMLGLLERAMISAVGTYPAISICEKDIALADQTLVALDNYENGKLSKPNLLDALRHAETGFNQNSIEFEPLVDQTVDAVSVFVVGLVIFKAIFVGICGLLMAKSVNADYVRLQEAETLLERTNSELQNFVYRTSHDFKSPLLGIKSMTQFLEEDIQAGETEDVLPNIRRIKKSVSSLENVVSSTLALAKTDLSDCKTERVELLKLIQSATDNLTPYAAEKNVELRIAEGVINVVAHTDRSHLSTAIENIVANGIKYADEDCESSFVEIDAIEDPNESIEIRIRDNGIGIPAEYKSAVFEMFKQFHPNRSDGTGLGMYIVKRSVERLGGNVWLESLPKGTCIAISIPKKNPALFQSHSKERSKDFSNA